MTTKKPTLKWECTRCKGKINFDYYWHYPICKKCRQDMIYKGDFNMTDVENRIFDERTRTEKK